nr:MAG TPA: peptidase [Caudoviricetes sp.]
MLWKQYGKEREGNMQDYTHEFIEHINILGTEYTAELIDENKDVKFKEADGYVDPSVHLIRVALFEPTSTTVSNIVVYLKNVMRHEIIHAYLFESGLAECSHMAENWATNEEMVDFIARQFPKMKRTMESLNCL